MKQRFLSIIFIFAIFFITSYFFLNSSFADTTNDDTRINNAFEAKNKLSINYANNVSPNYEILVNSNEKYIVTQSYSWVRDSTSRYNLVSYSIDDEEFIPISRKARGNFTLDISMDSSHSIVFLAVHQYPISVEGLADHTFSTTSPTGDNWFDAGSIATISVDPSNDFLIRNILDGWDGPKVESDGNSAKIIVDSPSTISAKWKTDYSQIILIGMIPVGVGIAYAIKQRKNSPKKSAVIEKTEEEISNGEESPQIHTTYLNDIREYRQQKSIEKLDSMRDLGLINGKKYDDLAEKLRNDT